jgi:hypothetical protein
MKAIVFYLLAALLFAAGAAAQDKKFAASLEAQVSCSEKLAPIKAVRALQKAGIISKSAYIVVDSVSYFKVRRPLNVLGYKIEAVSGFDYEPRVFERGPGTSPGRRLGIVVPASVEDVKSKLKALSSRKVMFEEAEDFESEPRQRRARTEITCLGAP